ncbi:hypothetical protein ACTSKR_09470 [Chitinibacteraceae bacterium HSL-7]
MRKQHKKPLDPYQKRLNLIFKSALQAGRQRQRVLSEQIMATSTPRADLLYWLLFVHGVNPHRKNVDGIVRGYDIIGKIRRAQLAGTWPPEPRANFAMLPWFVARFPQFGEYPAISRHRFPDWLK